MRKYYAGIGPRNLPSVGLQERVKHSAEVMASLGYVLRSGAAIQCDTIHEHVYVEQRKEMEIYLPWNGYNSRVHNPSQGYYSIDRYHLFEEAKVIASRAAPHIHNVSPGIVKLFTRNVLQILGANLKTRSDIVIYCTLDGVLKGGTKVAVDIAKMYRIPTRDLFYTPFEDSKDFFVFGSNLSGHHGLGAAKHALNNHGATYGQGIGFAGSSYALPTKNWGAKGTLPIEEIIQHVNTFLDKARYFPEHTFKVTRVGCGLAGLTDAQVAPLFRGAPTNCRFDHKWKNYLGDQYEYFTF